MYAMSSEIYIYRSFILLFWNYTILLWGFIWTLAFHLLKFRITLNTFNFNECGLIVFLLQAEEGEDDDEINQLFKGGKKKKKSEKSPAELALVVEHLMAELEVTAEADADLNRQNKPAINKLKKLPLLIEVLSK